LSKQEKEGVPDDKSTYAAQDEKKQQCSLKVMALPKKESLLQS